jgi:hypothetical protein
MVDGGNGSWQPTPFSKFSFATVDACSPESFVYPSLGRLLAGPKSLVDVTNVLWCNAAAAPYNAGP